MKKLGKAYTKNGSAADVYDRWVCVAVTVAVEPFIRRAKSVNPETVFADNIVGKPYIMIHLEREMIAKYGLSLESVQQHIETAIGGPRTAERCISNRLSKVARQKIVF